MKDHSSLESLAWWVDCQFLYSILSPWPSFPSMCCWDRCILWFFLHFVLNKRNIFYWTTLLSRMCWQLYVPNCFLWKFSCKHVPGWHCICPFHWKIGNCLFRPQKLRCYCWSTKSRKMVYGDFLSPLFVQNELLWMFVSSCLCLSIRTAYISWSTPPRMAVSHLP
jgi:hypothetical protein